MRGVSLSWIYLQVGVLLAGSACSVDDVGGEGEGGSAAVDSTAGTTDGATSQSSVDTTMGPVSEDGPIISDFGSIPDLPPVGLADCREPPPPGAAMPPALPTYDGTCPELVSGFNTIDSSGNAREFMFVQPSDLQPDERLPVVFLWHWLGGDATAFFEQGDVQNAVDQFRFVAVIPEEKGDLAFRWPFSNLDTDARAQEEFRFFDDMLACVGEQYNVAPDCVASAGVSAGALFTGQLASGRGAHLSSILSLSGGTGGNYVKPWGGSEHKMPAMVLWGGPDDFCVAVDFDQTSKDLEANLEADGHFILECEHNCEHSAPPFDVADGETAFAPLWSFVISHPYWLDDGDSPYVTTGVPDDMPEWCGIGVDGSTPREGKCGGSSC